MQKRTTASHNCLLQLVNIYFSSSADHSSLQKLKISSCKSSSSTYMLISNEIRRLLNHTAVPQHKEHTSREPRQCNLTEEANPCFQDIMTTEIIQFWCSSITVCPSLLAGYTSTGIDRSRSCIAAVSSQTTANSFPSFKASLS